MKTRTNRLAHSHIACGLALAISVTTFGDTITLKSAARQRDGATVISLSDIALIEGAEALRLAEVQVASLKPGANKPLEITVADVRRSLDAAGANWAKIHLSGRAVIVRPARDADSLPPQAMASVAIESVHGSAAPESTAISLDAVIGERSIRGSIANLISTNLRVDAREFRFASSDEDAALLSTALDAGRFQIQPLGSLAGDRIVFEVRGWNGSTIESKGQITLTVERFVPMTTATRDLQRGETVSDSDVETKSLWLTPSEATQAAPRALVVGRTLTRSIKAGESIRARDVERETAIKRGDLVNVRCLVGGVAISMQAEARGEGSIGDAIEFRKTGERESFMARITALGEAVVDLSRK